MFQVALSMLRTYTHILVLYLGEAEAFLHVSKMKQKRTYGLDLIYSSIATNMNLRSHHQSHDHLVFIWRLCCSKYAHATHRLFPTIKVPIFYPCWLTLIIRLLRVPTNCRNCTQSVLRIYTQKRNVKFHFRLFVNKIIAYT